MVTDDNTSREILHGAEAQAVTFFDIRLLFQGILEDLHISLHETDVEADAQITLAVRRK